MLHYCKCIGPTTIDALLRVSVWTISEMRAALANDTQCPNR